jgi:hypothetical protein
MLQMDGESAIRLELQANPTRFIEDRRNHYWRDHGVTGHHSGGRQSFALEEGCEVLEKWQVEHNPSCNKMHEIDMTHFYHTDTVKAPDKHGVQRTYRRRRQIVRYIADGGFRIAWMVSEYDGTKRALKTLKYVKKRHFDERNFERHRVDAVAMEQLTASPYVADVYGYCADSALVDYSAEADLYEIFEREIPPTKNELFKIAHDAASAVADMHHFNKDGRATIVNLDIKPNQWIHLDGMYKLNDFNLCHFLAWNATSNDYCGTTYGYGGGRVSLVLVQMILLCRIIMERSNTFSTFISYTVASTRAIHGVGPT